MPCWIVSFTRAWSLIEVEQEQRSLFYFSIGSAKFQHQLIQHLIAPILSTSLPQSCLLLISSLNLEDIKERQCANVQRVTAQTVFETQQLWSHAELNFYDTLPFKESWRQLSTIYHSEPQRALTFNLGIRKNQYNIKGLFNFFSQLNI